MKFFHTADWHLGKLVQGVYMTEDQREVLKQFIEAIEEEKPDAVIIAGDLYDRAVPPTEAVNLLDEVLETIILKLKTPVIAIAGNHDSPGRLDFGSNILKNNGCYIAGHLTREVDPIKLKDEYGEVHFHLVPYAEPSTVRNLYEDDEIRTHNEAFKKVITNIQNEMDENSRQVFVGHAFVTPTGEEQENTSESERPLAIGGAEHVSANLFAPFHYTALGHLHQAHYVLNETIQYSGSPLKYSISEELHNKSFLIVDMDKDGNVKVEKRSLKPKRDMRRVEAKLNEILTHEISDDYVFVRLLDETPVLSPMEQIRSVYPNAMHVERKIFPRDREDGTEQQRERHKMDELSLFKAFYREVKGSDASLETEKIFVEVLSELVKEDNESSQKTDKVTLEI